MKLKILSVFVLSSASFTVTPQVGLSTEAEYTWGETIQYKRYGNIFKKCPTE